MLSAGEFFWGKNYFTISLKLRKNRTFTKT